MNVALSAATSHAPRGIRVHTIDSGADRTAVPERTVAALGVAVFDDGAQGTRRSCRWLRSAGQRTPEQRR